jgi:hypothetical protein
LAKTGIVATLVTVLVTVTRFQRTQVRTTVVSMGLVALVVYAAPLRAQGLFTDARRAGMGGVSLSRDGTLERYNPAYRSVPRRSQAGGGPKFTIPLPIGLIQWAHDHPGWSKDPMFHTDSARFNPIETIDFILNPPFYYEVKKAPTPTNDVEFTVGRDALQVDLGNLRKVVPSDEFGVSGSSRPLDIEPGFKGFRAGVTGWLHEDVGLQLGDNLLAFLKAAQPAQHNTRYSIDGNGLVEGGIAPSAGYSGRIFGSDNTAVYVGAAAHYYIGAAYARTVGTGGITTGDVIFAGPNPVTPDATVQTSYSKWGNSKGHGVGFDVGFAWVSGPIEFGVGVNDIGATITWPDTRIDFQHYDTTHVGTTVRGFVTDSSRLHVESKTKLPVSYIANVAYTSGSSTVGVNLLNNGRGTRIHIGAEQRFGPFVVRGGVARDQRKKLELAGGGGFRLGPFELDAGLWTHSNSLSDERGITLASSLAIY